MKPTHHCFPFRATIFALAWLCCSRTLSAGPHIDIVVGPQAPQLERFAAEELAKQLVRLYEAVAVVVEKSPSGDAPLVLLGSPATNPAVKRAAGDRWPKLSNQGHVLRSINLGDRDVLFVGGGSPQATLWAAYELGHRLGIRYLLSGDVYPAEPGELKLSGYDALLEPSLKQRTWVGMGAEPIGMSAWGLEDQKRLLGQLAKLKFNRVVLRFEPWQPFVDFECHGVHKRTAQLWPREAWPIDSETPGRAAFHGAKEFSNPDFARETGYEAMTKTGIELARGVLQRARELGMATGIALAPFEFPNEFAETFPSRPLDSSSGLAVSLKHPGRLAGDAASRKLVETQLAAYLKTYPEIDAICLAPTRVDKDSAAERQGWADDAALLLDPNSDLLSPDRKRERLSWSMPLIPTKAPDKSSGSFITTTVITDGTGRRSALFFLNGETPGTSPRGSLSKLYSVVRDSREPKWSGFAIECNVPGDSELSIFYLSRAAFDAELTPNAACEELVAPMCGPAIAERLLLGFRAVERASGLADEHDPTFSSPRPDVVMKHYVSGMPAPEWWKEAKEGYLTAMTEALRANDRSLLPGRPWLRHLSKRMESAYEYMNAIEQAQLAGAARESGDAESQLAHLEAAVEAMYNSLRALGEVAADPSDRAVIAVLAEYGYRPLAAEFEKVQDAAE